MVHQSNQREWYQRLPRPCTVSSDLSHRRNTSYEQESLLGFGIFVTPSHLMSLVSGFWQNLLENVGPPHQDYSLNWENACSLGSIWVCKWNLTEMTFVSETDCSSIAAAAFAPAGPFIKWCAASHLIYVQIVVQMLH